jgi:hypothetical protein
MEGSLRRVLGLPYYYVCVSVTGDEREPATCQTNVWSGEVSIHIVRRDNALAFFEGAQRSAS